MKQNDELYFVQRLKVINPDTTYNNQPAVLVEDLTGNQLYVTGLSLISQFTNASSSTTTEEVSRTRLNELLNSSGGKSLTINFNKVAKADETKALLIEMAKQSIAAGDTKVFEKKTLKWYEGDLLVGEECTKTVYVTKVDDNGYCQAIDIDRLRAAKGEVNKAFMNINLKGTNWMILDGIKYVVKK